MVGADGADDVGAGDGKPIPVAPFCPLPGSRMLAARGTCPCEGTLSSPCLMRAGAARGVGFEIGLGLGTAAPCGFSAGDGLLTSAGFFCSFSEVVARTKGDASVCVLASAILGFVRTDAAGVAGSDILPFAILSFSPSSSISFCMFSFEVLAWLSLSSTASFSFLRLVDAFPRAAKDFCSSSI